MDKEINVIIAGSREFSNYELLKEVCDHVLENKIKDGYKITIISGHARGADLLGEQYATQKGFDLKIFPADWDKYGKKAGFKRNEKMAELGNALIAFFADGAESRGTKHMVKTAREKNLIVREIYERDFKSTDSEV
jgi:predicted Rossmann fold nucleotide-binding protein DprA/Smf involved in DNA uptake